MPILRVHPEDFLVEEIPLYDPEGRGSHTWIEIEKRERNTADVIRDLAAAAGVPERELGYAGRKDRRAVTRQWISVPRVDPEVAAGWTGEGWRVLRAERHTEKLRLGQLSGNRFEIVVREISAESAEAAASRLEDVSRRGFVNRFGDQRFGRHGGNAENGFALLRGERPPRDRRLARLWISAAQSEIFHRVLDRRGDEPWRALPGDVVADHRTGTWRVVDDPAEIADELEALRVSPTGPLPGPRVPRPKGEAEALEAEVISGFGLREPLGQGLPGWLAPRGDRRAILVPIGRRASAEVRSADASLLLRFRLPPGSYATVLVESVLGAPPDDAGRPG